MKAGSLYTRLRAEMRQREKEEIEKALAASKTVAGAAKLLGIHRSHIYKAMAEHSILSPRAERKAARGHGPALTKRTGPPERRYA